MFNARTELGRGKLGTLKSFFRRSQEPRKLENINKMIGHDSRGCPYDTPTSSTRNRSNKKSRGCPGLRRPPPSFPYLRSLPGRPETFQRPRETSLESTGAGRKFEEIRRGLCSYTYALFLRMWRGVGVLLSSPLTWLLYHLAPRVVRR